MSALTCKDFDERLLDYLYDELGVEEDQAIAAHLASCARCMMDVQAFRRVRQAARSLPIAEPSLSVTTRLLEAAAAHGASASAMGELSIASPPALRVVPPPARSASPALGSSLPSAAFPSAVPAPAAAKSAAPAAPRRRRGVLGALLHPGFAAAASFVVVGMGAAWFLTNQRDAMIAPGVSASAPAPSKAEPATVDRPSDVVAEENAPTAPSPAATPEPVPPPKSVATLPDNNLEDKKLEVKGNAERLAAAKDVAASDRMAAEGGALKTKAEAPAYAHAGAARLKAATGADDSLDNLLGAGGPGATRGAGMAPPVAARPGPKAESAATPAKGRQPSGDGWWLAPGENKELARSVGGAPAAAAPATAMNSMEAQKQDRRVDQRQQERAAAPAEDPTRASVQRRADELESAAAGKRAQPQQAVVDRDRSREDERPKKKASREYERSGSPIGQVEAAQESPGAAAPPQPQRPSATQAQAQAPSATASAAGSGPHDRQRLIAEFRGALLLNNCEGVVERYLAIGAQHAGDGLAARERLGVARCFVYLRRFDEARVELHAIRDQVPGARAQVDHELASVDQKEAALARRQAAPSGAKAARPPSRKKAAGPSSAKTLDADTAPAAY